MPKYQRRRGDRIWELIINKVESADLIALLVISGYLFLSWRGVITMLNSAVLVIVGFYFGHQVTKRRK